MGLDMTVYSVDRDDFIEWFGATPEDRPVNFDLYAQIKYGEIQDFELPKEEVWYWRKHPNLHGWFQQRWAAKGGQAEGPDWGSQFNGDPLVIDRAMLHELEQDLLAGALPLTTGFFFGASTPENDANTLKFIAEAHRRLPLGEVLIYTSSW